MKEAVKNFEQVWTLQWMRSHPVRTLGILFHLVFRTLFAIFWLVAGFNKVNHGWLTTDYLKLIFLDRLTEMPPDAFAVMYLLSFGIPMYIAVAWVVTIGEIYSALGLLFGITTRLAAAVSFFILFNLAIGGYYDASLLPFFILNLVFLWWPSGLWLGFDRPLARRYPQVRWFR